VAGAHSGGGGQRVWWSALQIGLTVVALAVLVAQLEIDEARSLGAGIDLSWAAAALGVALFDRVLMIAKWAPLLWVHAPDVPLLRMARAYLAAGLTNYLLPSTIGSDALRAVALGRPQGRSLEIAASIAAERLFGMIGHGVVAMLALWIALRTALPVSTAVSVALALLAIAVGAAILPLVPAVRRQGERLWREDWLTVPRSWLAKVFTAYTDYARYPGRLAAVGALTGVEVFFPFICHLYLARALGIDVSASVLLVAVSVSGLLARLPLSIAGLGVQELALASVLASYGIPAAQGAALGLAGRTIDVLMALPGVLVLGDLRTAFQRRRSVASES
jgi:uncharacterized membrane protein YbhN (UPF0104 family)